jgi:hypothetical protein
MYMRGNEVCSDNVEIITINEIRKISASINFIHEEQITSDRYSCWAAAERNVSLSLSGEMNDVNHDDFCLLKKMGVYVLW